MLLSELTSVKMVTFLTSQLNQIPSMVIFIDSQDPILPNDWSYQPVLWVKYIPGRRDVSLTCRGGGQVHRGVWHDMPGSLGHVDTVCNMKNKPIRIAHNMLPPFFAVNNGMIDITTLESIVLKTLLEKHNLRPFWVNAGQVWGNKDKTTGKWDGIVGLVKEEFVYI